MERYLGMAQSLPLGALLIPLAFESVDAWSCPVPTCGTSRHRSGLGEGYRLDETSARLLEPEGHP